MDVHFKKWQWCDLLLCYKRWALDQLYPGLSSSALMHANFGGVTSAVLYICYCYLGVSEGITVPCVPLTLWHILNAAEKGDNRGAFPALPAAPSPLPTPPPREPIAAEGLLWQEGLLDVHTPLLELACPCVFKPLGWALGRLSTKEWLRAFDPLLLLDAALLVNARA